MKIIRQTLQGNIEITLEELKDLIKQAKEEEMNCDEPNITCYAIEKVTQNKIYISKVKFNAWDY